MRQLISWENIAKIETQVKTNLEYFAKLRAAQLVRKRAKLDYWEKSLFAKDTSDIMRESFRGCFGYCRYLISLANELH